MPFVQNFLNIGINKNAKSKMLFYLGLLLRLLLIALTVSVVRQHFFIPFYDAFIHSPTLIPWENFLAQGGRVEAFPYGIVMFAVYLPSAIFSHLFPSAIQTVALNIGFSLTSLFFDYLLLCALYHISKATILKLIYFYWLSPIVIFINYYHAQFDIVPISLFVLSLYMLHAQRPKLAGSFCALSISAKLSMLIGFPIILIYLWKTRRMQHLFVPFLSCAIIVLSLTQIPFVFDSSYWTMVLYNPQVEKIFLLALNFNDQTSLYLLPIVFSIFLYCLWHIDRMNENLFYSLLGIGFIIVLISTPAAAGWYIWIVPFLTLHQLNSPSLRQNCVILLLSAGFVVFSLLFQNQTHLIFNTNTISLLLNFSPQELAQFQSYWLTALAMILTILCLQMYVKGVRLTDYYQLSRKPIAIGISGDSGTGKDTLSLALAKLFQKEAVTSVYGDDYHKWDRYGPLWQHLTHLNPKTNDLFRMSKDILSLLSGKSIFARHYDHKSGHYVPARKIENSDVIIANGLHVLYLRELLNKFDVKIFLKMDEELQLFFKLRRDVLVRGHTEEKVLQSIARRKTDRDQFIIPQAKNADIIFSLEPCHRNQLADYKNMRDIDLQLRITINHGFYYEDLARFLTSAGLMRVDIKMTNDNSAVSLLIAGEIARDDIEKLAKKLIPHMNQLLSQTPEWYSGMTGIMQLVTVLHIADTLQTRLI